MDSIKIIDQLLKKNDISDAFLIKECLLNHSALYHWRKGVARPTFDALVKIADYFKVSLDYLCDRETPQSEIQTLFDALPERYQTILLGQATEFYEVSTKNQNEIQEKRKQN